MRLAVMIIMNMVLTTMTSMVMGWKRIKRKERRAEKEWESTTQKCNLKILQLIQFKETRDFLGILKKNIYHQRYPLHTRLGVM